MVPPIAFAISWKKEKECLLELRLRWKLWEAVFHRPYGCKNKWCLYKDLGSEKTVIKQELRSLSSPLLSSYRRQKPSKPLLLGPCEFCRWPSQIELNGGAVRGVCVCVRARTCVHVERKKASQLTEQKHAGWCHKHDFVVLSTDSWVYFCAPLAGNTTKEIQVSWMHSHWWAFTRPDAYGGEVSGPVDKKSALASDPHFLLWACLWDSVADIRTAAGSHSHLLLHVGIGLVQAQVTQRINLECYSLNL